MNKTRDERWGWDEMWDGRLKIGYKIEDER